MGLAIKATALAAVAVGFVSGVATDVVMLSMAVAVSRTVAMAFRLVMGNLPSLDAAGMRLERFVSKATGAPVGRSCRSKRLAVRRNSFSENKIGDLQPFSKTVASRPHRDGV